jgi:hypothetical protein
LAALVTLSSFHDKPVSPIRKKAGILKNAPNIHVAIARSRGVVSHTNTQSRLDLQGVDTVSAFHSPIRQFEFKNSKKYKETVVYILHLDGHALYCILAEDKYR